MRKADSNGFKKWDGEKPRFSLVPHETLWQIVQVLEHGAKEYGAENWRLCTEPTRYYDAAQRHLRDHRRGIVLDEESGVPHLVHAIVNLMFMNELEGTDEDK